MAFPSSRYADALSDLFARAAGPFKLGLAAPRALLAALGSPERALGRVVLVAGTNGKGMTAALIARALELAGGGVGFFPSPHLLSFRERIQVDGVPVTEAEVIDLYDEVRRVEGRCPALPSFFECTLAMAALYFARRQVRATVLEVGLGGRLDATNVVPRELAVITPVGLDHEKLLGDTVAAIAAEKADIIPAQGEVVVAPQLAEARAVITRFAAERGARLTETPQSRSHATGIELVGPPLAEPLALEVGPHPPFFRLNWATAAAAAAILDGRGLACPAPDVRQAVATLVWPGRYQWIAGVPPMLVDGAHNPPAAAALAEALRADARLCHRPLHLVFSALRDKRADLMQPELAPLVKSVHVCPLRSRRARAREELAQLWPGGDLCDGVEQALEQARARARADGGVVLVTGSLKLVADVLALVTGAPADPPVDG